VTGKKPPVTQFATSIDSLPGAGVARIAKDSVKQPAESDSRQPDPEAKADSQVSAVKQPVADSAPPVELPALPAQTDITKPIQSSQLPPDSHQQKIKPHMATPNSTPAASAKPTGPGTPVLPQADQTIIAAAIPSSAPPAAAAAPVAKTPALYEVRSLGASTKGDSPTGSPSDSIHTDNIPAGHIAPAAHAGQPQRESSAASGDDAASPAVHPKPDHTPLAAPHSLGTSENQIELSPAIQTMGASSGPGIPGLSVAAHEHQSPQLTSSSTRVDPAAAPQSSATPEHQVLCSAPTKLEVGVFDDTHGWLRIRAELDTSGGISASLTAPTTAHPALHASLPQMAGYLQSEAIGVTRIDLHRGAEVSDALDLAQQGGQQKSGSGEHSQRQAQILPTNSSARSSDASPEHPESPTPAIVPAASTHDAGLGSWTRGLSRAMPRFNLRLAFPAVATGGWLNVSA
jgi:hypothetical protein